MRVSSERVSSEFGVTQLLSLVSISFSVGEDDADILKGSAPGKIPRSAQDKPSLARNDTRRGHGDAGLNLQ